MLSQWSTTELRKDDGFFSHSKYEFESWCCFSERFFYICVVSLIYIHRTSLAVQSMGIHLPVQRAWVWPLVSEESTWHGASKLMQHNHWAHRLQLLGPVHLSLCTWGCAPGACAPGACAPEPAHLRLCTWGLCTWGLRIWGCAREAVHLGPVHLGPVHLRLWTWGLRTWGLCTRACAPGACTPGAVHLRLCTWGLCTWACAPGACAPGPVHLGPAHLRLCTWGLRTWACAPGACAPGACAPEPAHLSLCTCGLRTWACALQQEMPLHREAHALQEEEAKKARGQQWGPKATKK